jgi:virulence factor
MTLRMAFDRGIRGSCVERIGGEARGGDMETVRVAFIGAGRLANSVHYPSVAENPHVRLVAVCDLDEVRLAQTADRYGVPGRYASYPEMLEREEIDAVYVIMPPHPLHEIVLGCLAAGKHVFTEKPPGVTTEQTRRWAEEAERRGLKSLVAFNRRYSAVVAAAKAAVQERGEPSMAMAEFHKDMLKGGPYWDLSILRTDIVHVVDVLRDLCGEPAQVAAHADHHYVRAGWEHSYNLYNALIRFEGGASGILSANRTSGNRYERFEYHGREVSAYIRAPERAEIWRAGEGETVVTGQELTGSTESRVTYGYKAETDHFIQCIREDRLPRTCFQDAVKTLELVDRIEAGGDGGSLTGKAQ